MSTPRVAVLIPSYNHARFLPATLASVLGQSLRPTEVIVVDDGSQDGSAEVAEAILGSARDLAWSVHRRSNRGISATRNELFALSRADFVAFLDSDDLYAAQRLERLLAGARPGRPWLAFSGVQFRHEGEADTREERLAWRELYRLRLGQAAALPTAGFALLRSNLAFTASNLVLSRETFQRVGGFDEGIRICQDWDFLVRALPEVEPHFEPAPLIEYRVHGGNTSRDAARTATHELDRVWQKAAGWMGQATPSQLAPTPRNWPRFFPLFARLQASGGPARLPLDRMDPGTVTPAMAARDASALRALVAEARAADDHAGEEEQELMNRCAARWEGGR